MAVGLQVVLEKTVGRTWNVPRHGVQGFDLAAEPLCSTCITQPHPAQLALQGIGILRGPVVSASRDTPHGLLQWRISVRDDGQRLFNGVLPTLIQWGAMHPTRHMPASGITLHQLRLRHAGAAGLRAALQALGLAGMSVVDGHEGPASLVASLDTPAHGRLTLLSPP